MLTAWTKEGGCYLKREPHPNDLFMKPKKIERWVIVYKNPAMEGGYQVVEETYVSEVSASEANEGGITAKIEWEE
jgi:hypothetical protein